MNKEMKKLLDLIASKTEGAKRYNKEGNSVKAKALISEIKELQEQYEKEKQLEEGMFSVNKNIKELSKSIKSLESISNIKTKKAIEDNIYNDLNGDIVAGYIKSLFYSDKDEDMNIIYDFIKDKAFQDGALLMPEDIKRDIAILRNEGISLETLVNVENVTSIEGSRTYDIDNDLVPLETVLEGENIPELNPLDFKEVKYKLVNKACIVNSIPPVVEETNRNIIKWMKTLFSKKSKLTRNMMIIDKLNKITIGKEVTATDITTLRNLILTSLNDQHKENAVALMNYAGYDYLNNIYNATTGEKIEVIKNGKLFDLYPVKILPKYLIPNSETKMSIFVGSLKEAITLFSQDEISFDAIKRLISNKYYLSTRLIDRVDVQAVDEDAVIKILMTI